MNGYELSRNWFNWCFENPEKIKPNHTALYFFAIEHCNRLGWKDKFGLPTTMAKEAIGIRSYNTYINTLNELVDWGFIKMVERSKNQHSSNIVALSNFDKALGSALDKALIKHVSKQSESTRQSIDSIDKQETSKPNNQEQETPDFSAPDLFEFFWNIYDKKLDKIKCQREWFKIDHAEYQKIIEHTPKFVKASGAFLCKPLNYLEGRRWQDEQLPNYAKKTETESSHTDFTKVEYP
jgi:hypothetical protein